MDWTSKEEIGNIVAMIRISVQDAARGTISAQQKSTLKEPAVKGPIWVAKFSLPPPPEDSVRQLLLQTIDENNRRQAPYTRPHSKPIKMEWTGFRKGVGEDTPEPRVPEFEKYHGLIDHTSKSAVVMFLYGGAFYMNTQASYRKITTQLSERTGLPCVTVHQSLCPQNPFPAALLDVFHGYVSLLSPPPGSPHGPVSASSIVIAGDSSGACLALSLLQVLLEVKRMGISSIKFHNRVVELEVPAGFTLLSTAGDLTNGLPSFKNNADTDIFPEDPIPAALPSCPSCEIWPSDPPRGNLYCDNLMLCHPIAAPAMARLWNDSPPLWFASGQEQLVDGAKIVAKVASNQGVPVLFQEYESMPHCFMWVLADSPQYRKCWDDWTNAIKTLLSGKAICTGGQFVYTNSMKAREMEVEDLTPLSIEEARKSMIETARNLPVFTGQRGAGPKM